MAKINKTSNEHHIELNISESAACHEITKFKVKNPQAHTKKKVVRELITGEECEKSTGEWVEKLRDIDKAKDKYVEVVRDPKTGKSIHRCEEKLSEHRGHGSAKMKKEK